MAMKMRIAVLLVSAIFLSLVFPVLHVQADVIVLPENDFILQKLDSCERHGRSYYANSKDGFVSLSSAPGANREVARFANGERLNITFTYDDGGEIWGIAEFRASDSERWTAGWLPMTELSLIYDYRSFEEDFGYEFYTYDSQLDLTGDVILWSWPGSGEIVGVFESDLWELEVLDFSYVYRDAEGREWGFIVYLYAIRNVWICISDPSNKNIPAFNPAPPVSLWPAADPSTVPQRGFSTPLLVIILVAVVALVTVVLIRVLWKKDKGSGNA